MPAQGALFASDLRWRATSAKKPNASFLHLCCAANSAKKSLSALFHIRFALRREFSKKALTTLFYICVALLRNICQKTPIGVF